MVNRKLFGIVGAVTFLSTCVIIGRNAHFNNFKIEGQGKYPRYIPAIKVVEKLLSQNDRVEGTNGDSRVDNTESHGSITFRKEVKLPGSNPHHQKLLGSVVDADGIKLNITSNITTTLVYSFSPSSEELFKSKIVDPMHQQTVLANSPAMVWRGNKFVVVMRMWLDKEETKDKTENVFSDNYFYKRTFTDKMEPLDVSGRIVGIPTRLLNSIGDGPIEPRAFQFYDKLYLSFNAAVSVNRKMVDTTMFWDFDDDKFVMPEIGDGQPQLAMRRKMPRDKHWSPYTYRNETYMVYSLDPLRIIRCDREAKCTFTQNAVAGVKYVFNDMHDCLRGGTPTLHYRDGYYISIAHTTLFRKEPKWQRYYTVNLVVLRARDPEHQIVYLSEPINFDPKLMSSIPIIRKKWIMDPFLFPVTLLIENDDSIIIGGHINDHSSYLFRVTGIRALMEKIISASAGLRPAGPAVGVLHNLAKDFAAAQSGLVYDFVS